MGYFGNPSWTEGDLCRRGRWGKLERRDSIEWIKRQVRTAYKKGASQQFQLRSNSKITAEDLNIAAIIFDVELLRNGNLFCFVVKRRQPKQAAA